MTKTIDDNNIKHISLLILKIKFLTNLCRFMLLVIILLTLSVSVGLNSPLISTQYVVRWVGLVLRFLTIYNTVCLLLLEKKLLTLFMGMGFKLPPFIDPKCG